MKKTVLLSMGLGLLFAVNAGAVMITPATTPQWSGPETGQKQIDAAIALIPLDIVELYKQNVGQASDTGVFKDSYSTTFANTPKDPSEATITYAGSPAPMFEGTVYLLVKDGKQDPGWYLFQLNGTGGLGWNGSDTIELSGFWPDQGAISHVSLYGGVSNVPDSGATLALFGLALMGVGAISGKLKR